MKIGYLGERGSFAEAAAAVLYAHEDIHTVSLNNYRQMFDALTDGSIEIAVARIENTYTGPNIRLLDFLRHARAFITAETRLAEVYNLAGHKGAKAAQIRRVFAHPTVIAQCQDYLERMEGVDIITRFDTAACAKAMMERRDPAEALVCGDFGAGIYGLAVLQRGIQTERESISRFAALGPHLVVPPVEAGEAHTLILLELKHKPGALLNIMAVMKNYDLNVHLMGNTTTRTNKWQYLLALEFPGRATDEHVIAAMKDVKQHTQYAQMVGSYALVDSSVKMKKTGKID
ncbi:MAG: hypothetical protein IT462_00365 [Planctomycetes bacterium]|nr:hypothetical protein [Planctomycetota bacterium]